MTVRSQTIDITSAAALTLTAPGQSSTFPVVRISNNSPLIAVIGNISKDAASIISLQPYTADIFSALGGTGNISIQFIIPGSLSSIPNNSSLTVDWSTSPKSDFGGQAYPTALPGTSLTNINGPVTVSGSMTITGPVTVAKIVASVATYGSSSVYSTADYSGGSTAVPVTLPANEKYLIFVVKPVGVVANPVTITVDGNNSGHRYLYQQVLSNKSLPFCYVEGDFDSTPTVTISTSGGDTYQVTIVTATNVPELPKGSTLWSYINLVGGGGGGSSAVVLSTPFPVSMITIAGQISDTQVELYDNIIASAPIIGKYSIKGGYGTVVLNFGEKPLQLTTGLFAANLLTDSVDITAFVIF